MYKVVEHWDFCNKELNKTHIKYFRSFKEAYEFAFSKIEEYTDNDYDVTHFETFKNWDETGTKPLGYECIWNLNRSEDGYLTQSHPICLSVEKICEGQTYIYVS